jgi:DNA invertase Pin-like site-specific DNA recombinase
MRAIAYDRVSTDGQAASGLGQDAQRAQVEAYCTFKGWRIVGSASDVISSKRERPGLEDAIARCEAGEADCIVAAKLSRLSRSTAETLDLIDRSHRKGWGLVALDADIDTTTPSGRMVATVIAAINEYERRMIAERTRDALAAARARGQRLGRERVYGDDVQALASDYAARYGYNGAARIMNAEGVPCIGQQWYPATVRKLVLRVDAEEAVA